MIKQTFQSQTVNDVTVETHNDFKTFTLQQRDVSIVLTPEIFRELASLIPLPDLETSGFECVHQEKRSE